MGKIEHLVPDLMAADGRNNHSADVHVDDTLRVIVLRWFGLDREAITAEEAVKTVEKLAEERGYLWIGKLFVIRAPKFHYVSNDSVHRGMRLVQRHSLILGSRRRQAKQCTGVTASMTHRSSCDAALEAKVNRMTAEVEWIRNWIR